MEKNKKYAIIDLFAGAGGMSFGFEQQGHFEVIAFVENNPNACETFKKNHSSESKVLIEEHNIVKLNFLDFKNKAGKIDVVIGGPPCQGFSNANRQKSKLISLNNSLVKKFIEAVLILEPKIFVMENVAMLSSSVHKFFKTNSEKTNDLKIYQESIVIFENNPDGEQIKDFLSRENIKNYFFNENYLALLKLLKRNISNEKRRTRYFEKYKDEVIKYLSVYKEKIENAPVIGEYIANDLKAVIEDYKNVTTQKIDNLNKLIEFAKAISLMNELIENDIQYELKIDGVEVKAELEYYTVINYIEREFKEKYVTKPQVLNAMHYGVPQERKRFIMIGIKKELMKEVEFPIGAFQKPRTVRDAIFDLEDIEPQKEVKTFPIIRQKLEENEKSFLYYLQAGKTEIHNHINTNTKETAMERFKAIKAGENFHSLDKKLKENTYTNSERTQKTIYLRLEYDKPCGTVVNVRKSMWIHPTKNRAISIREAARLQSFPDSFIFEGSKDSQYQQVGNAVPPLLAKAIADKIYTILCEEEK